MFWMWSLRVLAALSLTDFAAVAGCPGRALASVASPLRQARCPILARVFATYIWWVCRLCTMNDCVQEEHTGQTHICTRMHTHVHTHMRTHACTHAHTHARTHAYTHAHTHVHMHTRTHEHTHTRTHAHTHTLTHAHTHTRTHAHTHTEPRAARAHTQYITLIAL